MRLTPLTLPMERLVVSIEYWIWTRRKFRLGSAFGQKQTFKHYLELSRGTFLKLKGPRMWTFSLLLITC